MTSDTGLSKWTDQNNRIEFDLQQNMFDSERIIPLDDLYMNLDAVLRKDMLCHYSGTVSAMYWIALCRNPEYGHIQLVDLVDRSFPQIVRALRANVTNLTSLSLVSLGPGDGDIDIKILRHLEEGFNVPSYCCIDFSFELLRYAVARVSRAGELKNDFRIQAIWGDFAESNGILNRAECPRLFTLTGFTLGNYNEADLLGNIGQLMAEHDFLFVDAHLHNQKDCSGQYSDLEQNLTQMLGGYSQAETNRFVFGPVEAITTASSADVIFDRKVNRDMTSVPNALNVTISCKDLRTQMRFANELIERDHLDLATTTFYNFEDLGKWFLIAGFDCVWQKQEGSIALFLLKRSVHAENR
jgi:hypothetical protein